MRLYFDMVITSGVRALSSSNVIILVLPSLDVSTYGMGGFTDNDATANTHRQKDVADDRVIISTIFRTSICNDRS